MCVAAYISENAPKRAAWRFGLETETRNYNRVLLEDLIPVVRNRADGRGQPEAVALTWKATQALGGTHLASFNVRGEKIERNRLWRDSFGSRHCLIFADGFFDKEEVGKSKRYHYFTRKDGQPLALAGMWKQYQDERFEGEILTVVTTAPNADVADIHDRMPLTLPESAWGAWLESGDRKALLELVQPPESGVLKHWRITDDLFKRKLYTGPEVLKPVVDSGASQGLLF